jgi:hypothetical protein
LLTVLSLGAGVQSTTLALNRHLDGFGNECEGLCGV